MIVLMYAQYSNLELNIDSSFLENFISIQHIDIMMLLQLPPFFLMYYLLFIFILVAGSIIVTIVINNPQKFVRFVQGENGFLVNWWKWVNRKDPNTLTGSKIMPKYVGEKQLESWMCPICGSKISSQDVQQLEYGYDVECKYCGATISSSRMWR